MTSSSVNFAFTILILLMFRCYTIVKQLHGTVIHAPSRLQKKSNLVLHRAIITVCSEIHTKYLNAVCVQNVQGLNVKRGGPYSNHWVPKRKQEFQPHFAQCVFANGIHVYAMYRYASLNDGDTF